MNRTAYCAAGRERHFVTIIMLFMFAIFCLPYSAAAVELSITDNMVLWLRANAGLTLGSDGRVAVWADQSGLSHNATALGQGPRVLSDGSPSGLLDLLDFTLATNWHHGVDSSSVPEPSAITLLISIIAAVSVIRSM